MLKKELLKGSEEIQSKRGHLLSSSNQNRSKETKGHPDFVQTGLVVCDVPETKQTAVTALSTQTLGVC